MNFFFFFSSLYSFLTFKGEWRRDTGNASYLVPGELNNWIVLCPERKDQRDIVQKFVQRMLKMGKEKGIPMAKPEIIPFNSPEVGED